MTLCTIILYFGMQFVNSSFTLVFPTKQKSLEFIVTFQNSKGPSTCMDLFMRYFIPVSLMMFS